MSVVLPAFNEESNIEPAVARAVEVLEPLTREFEVIVVDDGSVDGTKDAVARMVEREHPRVRLLIHAANRGYGAALRTGFGHARYPLVFYTDSDLQFDVAEIEHFLPLADAYDVVVGFRVYRYDSVTRSLLSWTYNRIVRVLFRVRVRDVDCAFKLFRREVLDKITIDSTNFFVDAEILARARKWNFRITEKGVRHYPRTAGETTVRPSNIPETLREIARMWQQIYFPQREQLRRSDRARSSVREGVIEFSPGD